MHKELPAQWGELLSRLTPLPRCSLLFAPHSTGKRTCAEFLTFREGVHRSDYRLFPSPCWENYSGKRVYSSDVSSIDDSYSFVEPDLTIDDIRELRSWISVSSTTNKGKIAVVRLGHERADGSVWVASQQCQHALLKTIEEPPPEVKFILLSADSVLNTIMSRSVVVKSGLLSIDALTEILYSVSDMSREDSRRSAVCSDGRVSSALAVQSCVENASKVLELFTALLAQDSVALSVLAKGWSVDDTGLLLRALTERVSGRYRFFTDRDMSVLSLSVAVKLLFALRSLDGARPRIVIGALSAIHLEGGVQGLC